MTEVSNAAQRAIIWNRDHPDRRKEIKRKAYEKAYRERREGILRQNKESYQRRKQARAIEV